MIRSQVNSGVKAISQGLLDGGVEAVYNYPGFFSHDIFYELGGERISLNERVACAEAFGASLGGKRTAVSFKNVGLNVASDAFMHAVIAGVRAGMVVIVTDDISVWGSQESQDSRSYFDFFGGLWLEPATLQDAYDLGRTAFSVSEKYDVPVVIRLTNPFFSLEGGFKRAREVLLPSNYDEVEARKYVVHPIYYQEQQNRLDAKNHTIREYCQSRVSIEANGDHTKGVIVVGAAPFDVTAAPGADVARVDAYPLPTRALKSFVEQHSEIEVIEHGGSYVASKLRELLSEMKISSTTPHTRGADVTFSKWRRYGKFFSALQDISPDIVIGDITQFTVEETDSINVALSLGTAVSTAIGYAEAVPEASVFCLSGDCSFLHEGIGIIDEALMRGVRLAIVVFDNGGSWCTGGQAPAGLIERISDHERLQKINLKFESGNERDIAMALKQMRDFRGVSLLRIEIPMGSFAREEDVNE